MSLIDREHLLENIAYEVSEYNGKVRIDEIAYVIGKEPSVDAINVVRCRNCQYWSRTTGTCMNWKGYTTGKRTSGNFYCAYGERNH